MNTTASLQTPHAMRSPRPVIVGHRGAPAYRPEHTAPAYELAIDMGVDFIEVDLVVSRDGVLIARHENELSCSTDIAFRPAFAHRRTTKEVGGVELTGWFAEDFTLAELRRLRAVERMPDLRPLNAMYDGRFGILTFAEVVGLARRRSSSERRIRVLAELKHPTWSAEQGLPMAELVAAELRRLRATGPQDTIVVQSFDAAGLRHLRARLGVRGPTMLQLINDNPQYDPMTTPTGLREISTYAQGIAPSRHRLILRDADDAVTGVSDLVDRAHSAGLCVIPWTVRAENAFLPRHLRRGDDPAGFGDAAAEVSVLMGLGVDGVITDHPDIAARARRQIVPASPSPWPHRGPSRRSRGSPGARRPTSGEPRTEARPRMGHGYVRPPLQGVARRCLLVDDNPGFLSAARTLLEQEGMRVVGTASTSAEAVREVAQLRPDVTLIDVELAGESGFHVVRDLVEDPALEPGQLILISAYAQEDLADLIQASPALGFLGKRALSGAAIERLLNGAGRSRGRDDGVRAAH